MCKKIINAERNNNKNVIYFCMCVQVEWMMWNIFLCHIYIYIFQVNGLYTYLLHVCNTYINFTYTILIYDDGTVCERMKCVIKILISFFF